MSAATVLIQGGGTLRAEGGQSPELPSQFYKSLVQFRSKVHKSASTTEAEAEVGGVYAIITSGKCAIDPAWPLFGSGDSHTAHQFRPVVFCPDDRIPHLSASFQGVACEPPTFIAASAFGPRHEVDIPALLQFLSDSHGRGKGATPAHARLRDTLPASVSSGSNSFIIIETGPTVTRGLYTEVPKSHASSADTSSALCPLSWVKLGRPVAPDACPVDWLFLSTFDGPCHPDAQGAPVVTRSALDTIFEVVSVGAAYGDSNPGSPTAEPGVWRFHLLRNRRLAATVVQ